MTIGPIYVSLRLANHLARITLSLSLTLSLVGLPKGRAATFMVTNAADSGAGTLRQAILDANATNGLDTITFQIPGTGVHTITPLTTLPAVTDPAIIDGTTQPGYVTQPLIELNGTGAGNNAGLRLTAGKSTVRGLAINRFQTDGIELSGAGTNVVAGNYIGTDPTGLIARPNALEGVLVTSSTGNTIGGTTAADRNLISGNTDAGVYLLNSTGNVVLGNYIGTTVTATTRLGNANNGVAIYNSSGNQVGGPNTASRNILSGNTGSGLYLFGAGSAGNVIQGNYVGTDVSGTLSVSNGADGISCQGASNNSLGGTNAGAGNVISGNGLTGVSVSGGSTSNLIQGNLIGLDASGTVALPNILAGVTLVGSSGNTIGGTSGGARNVISGNKQHGLFITTNSTLNTVAGNFIGLNTAGGALANLWNGVFINSASNTIGGTVPGAGNVISGNTQDGIYLSGNPASNNVVQGNFIGTESAGSSARANGWTGIYIESAGNKIGGPGVGNVISGNGLDGIFITGIPASNNLVQANLIGTAAGGMSGLGNGRAGLGLSGATANIIGTPGAGNVISANKTDAGIYLIGIGATRNQIQANILGADAAGNAALGNFYEGIYLERAATNTIGGTVAGAGNVISGNSTRGIWLTNASWNVIQGNLIGTKSDSVSALGNVFHGVECETGATNNTIGGSTFGAGNHIAFAQGIYSGVRIRAGSTNNAILGNSIFANGALGIDLGPFGVTPNDAGDADTGANMQQNFPVITQAVTGGSGVGIRGNFNSLASKTFLLQFFASPTCDGSGNGEGQIYLGDKSVVTDGSGNASFVATFANALPVGYVISSTATDPANNTSEFSPCLATAAVPPLFISPAAGSQVTLAWPNTTSGFVLKQTGNLAPPVVWTTVTNVPVNTNGNFVVTTPGGSTNRFFLLSFE